jgi:hypothetical protein
MKDVAIFTTMNVKPGKLVSGNDMPFFCVLWSLSWFPRKLYRSYIERYSRRLIEMIICLIRMEEVKNLLLSIV